MAFLALKSNTCGAVIFNVAGELVGGVMGFVYTVVMGVVA